MSKLDAIQNLLSNDLRVFREPFFNNMIEVREGFKGGSTEGGGAFYRVPDLGYFETWYINGIVGGRRPSTYSESPGLWNRYFIKTGIKGVLFGLDLPPEHDFNEFFMKVFDVPQMIDLTITDPYKQNAFEALMQARIPVKWSDQAINTGSVNHIIMNNKTEEFLALNTDGIGMFRAIEKKADIHWKKVLIIGAGGSAASIGYEFVNTGCELTVANRTPGKAEDLLKKIAGFAKPNAGKRWGGFEGLDTFLKEADIIINTVPQGCPIDKENITKIKEGAVIAETKYGPKADLKDMALQKGIEYVDGRSMLFEQFVEAATSVFPLLGISKVEHEKVIKEMEKINNI